MKQWIEIMQFDAYNVINATPSIRFRFDSIQINIQNPVNTFHST